MERPAFKPRSRPNASADHPSFADALAYSLDAWQRSILFLDVMRQLVNSTGNTAYAGTIPPEGVVVDTLKPAGDAKLRVIGPRVIGPW
ncbi:hypothetical protein [Sinorhizobium medicae]|uniref:hypothetical protein n=1 Tax=Sinorhizobium medicae TaxID=110321 RepID=UPI001295AA77|nr:hypothetical protein [Sinorhizobium medicae]MQX79270.1 hypothetical protein [Sinorhizobium medicae]